MRVLVDHDDRALPEALHDPCRGHRSDAADASRRQVSFDAFYGGRQLLLEALDPEVATMGRVHLPFAGQPQHFAGADSGHRADDRYEPRPVDSEIGRLQARHAVARVRIAKYDSLDRAAQLGHLPKKGRLAGFRRRAVRGADLAAAGRPHHVSLVQQKRLDDVDQRVLLLVYRRGKRLDSDRPAVVILHDGIQVASIELVQPIFVDAFPSERLVGDRSIDAAVAPDLGIVANALQEAIGDARRSARAASDLVRSLTIDRRLEKLRRPLDYPRQLFRRVEIEVVRQTEAVPERCAQEAGPRGGAHQGKALQRKLDRPRVRSLLDDEVDREVFHRGVEKLLDGARKAMDLVDEQHTSGLETGENAHEIALPLERGP